MLEKNIYIYNYLHGRRQRVGVTGSSSSERTAVIDLPYITLPQIYGSLKRNLLVALNPLPIGVPKHGIAYLPYVSKR